MGSHGSNKSVSTFVINCARGTARVVGAALALVLVTALLVVESAWPANEAIALETQPSSEQEAPDPQDLERTEMTDLRTETSRTYLQPDGSYEAEFFTVPIHYEEQGTWKPIDNTLVSSTRPGSAYENKMGPHDLYLPEDIGDAPVRFEVGGDWIEFTPVGAHGNAAITKTRASFEDAFPGVDITYEATGSGVKESIIVSNLASLRPFAYALETSPGLSVQQGASGGIELKDQHDKLVATLDPPFMYDASGQGSLTNAVTLELGRDRDGLSIVVVPDPVWLADPDRQWPVVIDPTVTLKPTSLDCWIGNGSGANSSNCGGGSFRVGYTGSLKRRSLLKFDLSSLPSNATVTSADLALYLDASQTTNPGANADYVLRRIEDDPDRPWTNAVTWNKYDGTNSWTASGGDFGNVNVGVLNLGGGTGGYKHWFPSSLVNNWVTGTFKNRGFMLKQAAETTGQHDLFPFLRVVRLCQVAQADRHLQRAHPADLRGHRRTPLLHV